MEKRMNSKTYSLYSSESEDSYTFFEENDKGNINLLPKDAKLIWKVTATSWFEAQTKMHEYLGWEPYKD